MVFVIMYEILLVIALNATVDTFMLKRSRFLCCSEAVIILCPSSGSCKIVLLKFQVVTKLLLI